MKEREMPVAQLGYTGTGKLIDVTSVDAMFGRYIQLTCRMENSAFTACFL